MNRERIKILLREELNASDERKIKQLARDEFDKMFKKHLSSSDLEKKVQELVLNHIKKDKPTQKEIASITKEVLVKLYKTLWTKKGFWSNGLENI